MRPINNVLAIPEESSYFIGEAVHAYLNGETLKLGFFLCQLYGLPARFIYCDVTQNLIHIDDFSIHLSSWNSSILSDFEKEDSLVEDLDLIPLRALTLYSYIEGFIGLLRDFEVNSKNIFLDEVWTIDENWKIKGTPQLQKTLYGTILLLKDIFHGHERVNSIFSKKKLIQNILQEFYEKILFNNQYKFCEMANV